MKKMISYMGALGIMASTAYAASATVWSAEGDGDKAPAYWYSYEYGTGASIDTSTTVDNIKVANMTAKAGNTSNGAGFGFAWQQNSSYKDVPISLSGFKGMCLTYRATAPFRVDFKQSTITDDNYYGAELAAASGFKKQFIAFADLKQGWKSTSTVAWNVGVQTGVQFGFKNTHATAALNTNTVEISSIILGDKCETKPPVYVGEESGTALLNEGEPLDIDLSTIFSDEDGDAAVTALIATGKAYASFVNPKASYELGDHVYMAATPNENGVVTVILTADDGVNESISYTLTVTVKDRDNAPTAVNDTFTVKEDSVLTVKVQNGILKNDFDIDDPNGLALLTIKVTGEPENGTVEFETNTQGNLNGAFTYTPNPDFNGTDFFTYTLTDTSALESAPATVFINVTPVNDPMILESVNAALFKDTLQLEEDFDTNKTDAFEIPATAFVVSDADGLESVTYGATSSGIIKVSYGFAAGSHYISFSPIANAYGLAKVTFWAKSGKDSVGVDFFVNVASVPDLPVAAGDSYKVVQDSLNKVVKPGVLKNDSNPDGKSTLKAILVEDASEGKVELAEDGSFTYKAGHYEGLDSFAYVVVNEAGDTSLPAAVILTVGHKNQPPQAVAGIADTVKRLTTLTEDFGGSVVFLIKEMQTWFTDDTDDATKLTFTARSDDSLLSPTVIASTGAIQVKAVKDACGETELIIVAKDLQGATGELAIPAVIACKNDRPVIVKSIDTLYAGTGETWDLTYELLKNVSDPDGDSLTFKISPIIENSTLVTLSEKDGILSIVSAKDSVIAPNKIFPISITVSDAEFFGTFKLLVIAKEAPASISPALAMPKASWQNAILANCGTVAIFDMQGRVMWKAMLPVSEADVRNAAAKVQGRKILQVNRQTWTIK